MSRTKRRMLQSNLAAAVLGAAMLGVGQALPNTTPKLRAPAAAYEPETSRNVRRRRRKEVALRKQRGRFNAAGYTANRERRERLRRARPKADIRKMAIVSRMTNWERNQWARAGYPAQIEACDFAQAAIKRLDGTYLNFADGKTYAKGG